VSSTESGINGLDIFGGGHEKRIQKLTLKDMGIGEKKKGEMRD
jgi:hypothetical protein